MTLRRTDDGERKVGEDMEVGVGGFITSTYKLSPQCVSQLIKQCGMSCDSCGSWSAASPLHCFYSF